MHKSLTLDAHCPSASSPPELPQVLDKKEQHLCGGGDRHSDSTSAVTCDCRGLGWAWPYSGYDTESSDPRRK